LHFPVNDWRKEWLVPTSIQFNSFSITLSKPFVSYQCVYVAPIYLYPKQHFPTTRNALCAENCKLRRNWWNTLPVQKLAHLPKTSKYTHTHTHTHTHTQFAHIPRITTRPLPMDGGISDGLQDKEMCAGKYMLI